MWGRGTAVSSWWNVLEAGHIGWEVPAYRKQLAPSGLELLCLTVTAACPTPTSCWPSPAPSGHCPTKHHNTQKMRPLALQAFASKYTAETYKER